MIIVSKVKMKVVRVKWAHVDLVENMALMLNDKYF